MDQFSLGSLLSPLYDVPKSTGAISVPASTAAEPMAFTIACSDETTAITSTGVAVTFRMAVAMTLNGLKASLTAGTTGTFTIDVQESGTTILSTLLTFDASATTTVGATTPVVISDPDLADDAEITIEIIDVGGAGGLGLKVTFLGVVPPA